MPSVPPGLWLASPGGARARIRAGGVLVGRAAGCDLVIDEPTVSRVHAIVHLGSEGAVLTVLGQAPLLVNAQEAERTQPLAAGDRVEIGGRVLEVQLERADDPPPSTWMLRDSANQLFGVNRSPFVVGSAADADLRLASGPGHALRFHLADELHVEALADIAVDDAALGPGEVAAVRVGGRVTIGDAVLAVVAGGAHNAAATAIRRGAPDRVTLEFLPRGGRLSVGWGEHERLVYLPERRCDLVALLLQPPVPHAAGDFVPDDLLIARLWQGQPRTRADLNTVIHRTRTDLLRGELDGGRLVQRAEGGLGTRFDVNQATRITVL